MEDVSDGRFPEGGNAHAEGAAAQEGGGGGQGRTARPRAPGGRALGGGAFVVEVQALDEAIAARRALSFAMRPILLCLAPLALIACSRPAVPAADPEPATRTVTWTT